MLSSIQYKNAPCVCDYTLWIDQVTRNQSVCYQVLKLIHFVTVDTVHSRGRDRICVAGSMSSLRMTNNNAMDLFWIVVYVTLYCR